MSHGRFFHDEPIGFISGQVQKGLSQKYYDPVSAGISAGVGAATSIGGGIMGKGAAKKARKRLAAGVGAASGDITRGMELSNAKLEEGYEVASGKLDNYASLGEGALAKLAFGLGFDVPGFDTSGLQRGGLLENFNEDKFRADPGYEFVRSEGQRGIENSAAARGNVLSGATLKALTRFNQGTADQQYQNSYNRYNADRQLQTEMLSGVAGRGQMALNTQAGLRENTSRQQASNISDRYTNNANLHMALAGGSANLALKRGNYAQNSIQGAGQAFQSFFSDNPFASKKTTGYGGSSDSGY